MKVLNLYAGIGGNRKLWEDVEVTAVEIDPQIAEIYKSYFPDDNVIIGDAHQYLLDHYKEFDFIWASPPCPTHSKMYYAFGFHGHNYKPKYIDMNLFQEIILMQYFSKALFCVENVMPYYQSILINDYTRLGRHLFWSNFTIKIKYFSTDGGISGHNKNKKNNKLERNKVNPEIGLHILNCARNIITKSNVNQLDIFDK